MYNKYIHIYSEKLSMYFLEKLAYNIKNIHFFYRAPNQYFNTDDIDNKNFYKIDNKIFDDYIYNNNYIYFAINHEINNLVNKIKISDMDNNIIISIQSINTIDNIIHNITNKSLLHPDNVYLVKLNVCIENKNIHHLKINFNLNYSIINNINTIEISNFTTNIIDSICLLKFNGVYRNTSKQELNNIDININDDFIKIYTTVLNMISKYNSNINSNINSNNNDIFKTRLLIINNIKKTINNISNYVKSINKQTVNIKQDDIYANRLIYTFQTNKKYGEKLPYVAINIEKIYIDNNINNNINKNKQIIKNNKININKNTEIYITDISVDWVCTINEKLIKIDRLEQILEKNKDIIIFNINDIMINYKY